MSSSELREELKNLIEDADDRLLKIIYAVIQADHESTELSEAHQEILNGRLEEHERNPDSGASWEEVMARVKSKL